MIEVIFFKVFRLFPGHDVAVNAPPFPWVFFIHISNGKGLMALRAFNCHGIFKVEIL